MKKLNIGRIPTVLIMLGIFVSIGAVTYGITTNRFSAERASASVITSFISTNTFAVLAGTGITNTGSTVINGDIGSFATPSIGGFPPGILGPGSTNHGGDGVTQQAKIDLQAAYNYAAAQASTSDLTGQDLGGMNLLPGVYHFSSAAQLTGPLTLTGSGVYIFQIGTTLTTASASSVILAAGAESCNVFWQVGSSATLGTASTFEGTIMADQSITLTTSATLDGRALAQNGAVTLDSNTITIPSCGGLPPPTPTTATFKIIKTVVNTNGGTKTVSDFPLFIGASPMVSGVATTTLAAGSYTATETNTAGYTASAWGGDCNADGTITLAGGADKTCTITNTEVTPVSTRGVSGQFAAPTASSATTSTTSSATDTTVTTVSTTTTQTSASEVAIPVRTVTTPALPNSGYGPRK
ncbi:MAG: ice-binding family protein [Candidatus Paceibacterota bacterium]